MSPNRVLDSNGPDMKVRGSAAHITEKYRQLARDANAAGDRVAAENYLQHAEHYHRLLTSMQEHTAQQRASQQTNAPQPESRQDNRHENRDDRRGGAERDADGDGNNGPGSDLAAPSEPVVSDGEPQDAAPDRPLANGGEEPSSEAPEKRAEPRRPVRRKPRSSDAVADGESAPKPRRRSRKTENADDKPEAEVESAGDQLPDFISGKSIS